MILSDEDKQGLSADEIKALEQAEEGEGEALLLVDGEAPPADKATNQEDGDKEDDKPPEKAADAELDESDLDLIEGEGDKAPAPAAPTKFDVEERDYAAELKAVRAERSDIEQKWTEGELTDAERNTQIQELEDKRDALLIEQTRAQTLAEINRQNAERTEQAALNAENAAIVALVNADKAKGDSGLSYHSDADAQRDFDAALNAAKSSASHAGKSPAELVQAAHKMVMAMRGLNVAEAKSEPSQQPKSSKREVPPSLGGLPDAGRAPGSISDDNWAKFSTLQGEAAERFMAGLPEAEVDRLTRLADSKMFS